MIAKYRWYEITLSPLSFAVKLAKQNCSKMGILSYSIAINISLFIHWFLLHITIQLRIAIKEIWMFNKQNFK